MRNDNKGRDIFMGVVAIATLIVAIVGATLAYFSITASSNEGAVNAQAAVVSIEYNDGQQVTAQADELIPATLNIVQTVYEANVKNSAAVEDTSTIGNTCIDSNSKQVCSAYRFTIRSDIERTVTAALNNEYNGFTYLSYAVYNVTKGSWMVLTDDGDYSLPVSTCSNNDEGIENCFNIEGRLKKYTDNATNSIFGLTTVEGVPTKKTEQVSGTTQVFDIVLFIKETNENQNIDQGQQYNGTIIVDVLDGSVNGSITGCVGDNC